MKRVIGFVAVMLLLGASCGRGSHDDLSEKDRAFYGFLSVKANDKAFIPPCS